MALARAPLACLVVLACAVAGCGEEPVVTLRGPLLRLRLTEFRIEPQDVRVAPGRLTIVARDAGVLTHSLEVHTIDRYGDSGSILAATHVLHPGESGSVTLTLAPGRYALECGVGNHATLGETGTLIVGGRS